MPSKKLQKLIYQRRQLWDGDPWLGNNFQNVLEDINLDMAFWKPHPHAKSVIELLWHVLAWRMHFVRKLQNDSAFSITLNSDEDWIRFSEPDIKTWEQLKIDINENDQKINDLLEGFIDEPHFLKRLSYNDFNFEQHLLGIIQHDIYHLGQIAMLKALYKSTNTFN